MATISDELAASIQKCFNQTYSDLANQQNIFFGTGDVTITKPDGGKKTVSSWEKVNQAISKLQNGELQGRALYTASIELSEAMPYIDFHCGNSTADYTHRIIAWDKNALNITSGLTVEKNLNILGFTDSTRTVRCYDSVAFLGMDTKDPQGGTGAILAAPKFSSRFPTRGADSHGSAGMHLWFEEYAGYNHKAVISVQGYSAEMQFFQFLNDGQILGNRGYVQWAGTSDINYKKDVHVTDGQASLDNICAMELVTFVYKDDEHERVRRGVIAQQIREIDETYVKESALTYQEAGKAITKKKLVLDSNPLLMDALAAIQVLARRVEELEKTG